MMNTFLQSLVVVCAVLSPSSNACMVSSPAQERSSTAIQVTLPKGWTFQGASDADHVLATNSRGVTLSIYLVASKDSTEKPFSLTQEKSPSRIIPITSNGRSGQLLIVLPSVASRPHTIWIRLTSKTDSILAEATKSTDFTVKELVDVQDIVRSIRPAAHTSPYTPHFWNLD